MTARKRTARILRTLANRMDPPLPRWYASAWQQSAQTYSTTTSSNATLTVTTLARKPKRRVLADYLTILDLKKLRP